MLYGLLVGIRNLLFDKGLLRSVNHPLPLIVVGNITTGGTGKTPHVEYLIRLLSNKGIVATLSRGYGRKTKGYKLATTSCFSEDIGDEPMQYVSKFQDILVAVDEDRNNGIANLLKENNPPEIIILDDAFQHRYVKPGLSILLTDFYHPHTNDYLLPSGKLREPISSASRADVIVISKCPLILSPIVKRHLIEEMKPKPQQKIFFSYYRYSEFISLSPSFPNFPEDDLSYILVFAGIANPYPIQEYLIKMAMDVEILPFRDHHPYTVKDIESIRKKFEDHYARKKVIITTEKDAMRLKGSDLMKIIVDLPVFYLPIEVKFHDTEESFDNTILNYVERSKTNH